MNKYENENLKLNIILKVNSKNCLFWMNIESGNKEIGEYWNE